MNLHEFQAKEILSNYGVPVPEGRVAWTAEEAAEITRSISAPKFAVKAQVHAGGRGIVGGVRLAATSDVVRTIAGELLGSTLITDQTGPEGCTVSKVYVEAGVDAAREIYVAVLVDGRERRITLIGSPHGGDDFEARAAADPGIIEKLPLEASGGVDAPALTGFAHRLGLDGPLAAQGEALFRAMIRAFVERDASLIEINPLAVTGDDALLALDIKMVVDDNALFRHPELKALRDEDELDPVELEAQRHEINYVRMDGNIGVVVNGAGLALATHDMLRDAGGRPANFMDIRTTATSLDIANGLALLFANPKVKVVLVNVHGGGMTRCDTIAEALGLALRRTGRVLPIVFRAAGHNAEFARTVLRNYGIAFDDAPDMASAVDRVVSLTGKAAA